MLFVYLILFSGDRLLVLLIEAVDIRGRGCGRVLPAAVEPDIRGDAGPAAALQPHSRHHTQYRHLSHLHDILQRL